MLPKTQKLKSKIGEVAYRSKLVRQYRGRKVFFENEPDKLQIIASLKERTRKTKHDLHQLKKVVATFSPYLEIGAEFGHRAGVLEQKYRTQGFATDISLESLKMAPFFAKKLSLGKTPKRICVDANNLPFADNSFNFVFCYQTLHHFPDPCLIIEEAYRVLRPGGYFFVNEEPVKQSFNLNLWRRPTKLRSFEKLLKLLLILPFLSRIGKTETGYSILEEVFDLKTWENSLSKFENVSLEIVPYPFGPRAKVTKKSTKNWLKPKLHERLFIFILGGGIKFLAKKKGFHPSKEPKIDNLIVCPKCKDAFTKNLICPKCRFQYPKVGGVPILIEKDLLNKLYPQYLKHD